MLLLFKMRWDWFHCKPCLVSACNHFICLIQKTLIMMRSRRLQRARMVCQVLLIPPVREMGPWPLVAAMDASNQLPHRPCQTCQVRPNVKDGFYCGFGIFLIYWSLSSECGVAIEEQVKCDVGNTTECIRHGCCVGPANECYYPIDGKRALL